MRPMVEERMGVVVQMAAGLGDVGKVVGMAWSTDQAMEAGRLLVVVDQVVEVSLRHPNHPLVQVEVPLA